MEDLHLDQTQATRVTDLYSGIKVGRGGNNFYAFEIICSQNTLINMALILLNRMGDSNIKEGIWKRLFNLLFNSNEPDDELLIMWTQYKAENLHRSDIRKAIESLKDYLHKDSRKHFCDINSEGNVNDDSLLASPVKYQLPKEVIDKLCDLSIGENGGAVSILAAMRKCAQLDDNFWRLLFTAIRDREVDVISEEKRIPILEGGQTKHMSMTNIEQKFNLENPDLLTAQKAVPDQMIHDDLIDAHFNTKSVRESLKRSYDERFFEAKKTIAEEHPKLTNELVEKQAAAQAKTETKELREAKLLQHRVAMMAEDEVQKSILAAMREFGIPVYVLRGVNTYDNIGKFLERFDIKMSMLKAFKSGDSKGTLECEHDIGIFALPPSGPLVSFNQVVKP